jgi:hypothetical protein
MSHEMNTLAALERQAHAMERMADAMESLIGVLLAKPAVIPRTAKANTWGGNVPELNNMNIGDKP